MLKEKKLKRQRYREKLRYIYYEYILPIIIFSVIIFFELSIFINFFL